MTRLHRNPGQISGIVSWFRYPPDQMGGQRRARQRFPFGSEGIAEGEAEAEYARGTKTLNRYAGNDPRHRILYWWEAFWRGCEDWVSEASKPASFCDDQSVPVKLNRFRRCRRESRARTTTKVSSASPRTRREKPTYACVFHDSCSPDVCRGYICSTAVSL
ncbi:hypothetical protein BD779DRAFT_1785057, partial [Infundibulicybe gibba]